MKTVLIILSISIFVIVGCSSAKTGDEKNMNRDGMSVESAIKVNSVSAEYEYLREYCIDCKFVSQALIMKDDKPYDVLTVMTPEGDKVSYYFDISEFYGKMFK